MHQLEQDITQKEEEIKELTDQLTEVTHQNEQQQQTMQKMESKHTDEQSKWVKLCERVGSHMDEHRYVYSNKFPMDPFSRDTTFQDSSAL